MAYTALDVKALRDKTGLGMMDCKKALEENAGDMEKAIDYLRKKGLAASASKSRNSPFGGWRLKGKATATIANGVVAWAEGGIFS